MYFVRHVSFFVPKTDKICSWPDIRYLNRVYTNRLDGITMILVFKNKNQFRKGKMGDLG
jgi:hypothetical protein